MSKKYTSRECRQILEMVLNNALHHIYTIELQVKELCLKMDGTDSPEALRKGQIYTLVLTILNDAIHSAHGYLRSTYDAATIDRFIANQKIAFDNNLVNPCGCPDCKKRGYTYYEMEMERRAKSDQRKDDTAKTPVDETKAV